MDNSCAFCSSTTLSNTSSADFAISDCGVVYIYVDPTATNMWFGVLLLNRMVEFSIKYRALVNARNLFARRLAVFN